MLLFLVLVENTAKSENAIMQGQANGALLSI